MTVGACLSTTLQAHPHVFVNTQVDFRVSPDRELQALHVSWQYDAFTTLYLFDVLDLDRDSDGKLNDEDRAAIVVAETEWPEGYDGDIHLAIDGELQSMGVPQNGAAEMVDGQIIVSFDLPLTASVDMSGKQASLRLYDPAYYYAYSVAVVSDTQTHNTPCQATAFPFVPDKAAARTQRALATLSREETPEQADIGAQFSDEVTLICD